MEFSYNNLQCVVIILFLSGCAQVMEPEQVREVQISSPEELYGQLFYDVQSQKDLFPDSKTFVDAVPKFEVAEIRMKYAQMDGVSTPYLLGFLEENFDIPTSTPTYQTDSSSIKEHISKLWGVLKRPSDERLSGTLLPLPYPYIVPGGRFREIYYWDSYFTMLGLQVDDEIETIRNMLDNFSYLIDTYGFIPNGNRAYYLGRSQPPFFAKMVEVLAAVEGQQIFVEYLPYMEKEYNFWMNGAELLTEANPVNARVVRLSNGIILNRYWDEYDTPRPESYREDIRTADEALTLFPNKSRGEVYRNLRAAAESGWDFSSRWLLKEEGDSFRLSTIHTTDILPVDLNSLLYNLEYSLARAHKLAGNTDAAETYRQKYESRKEAIHTYFWNSSQGYYMDYNFKEKTFTEVKSLAGMYPLFCKIANVTQANQVAETVERLFLRPGGVVTTPYHSDQQWDAPNGWAPLQWLTISGLRNYGHDPLASTIKGRWLQLNTAVYKRTYKLLEKYNVEDLSEEGGGGEYPTQDGFGWTNGVYQKLAKE